MSGEWGLFYGITGTLLALGIIYLVYSLYKAGADDLKDRLKKLWYLIRFKVHAQDCISCLGDGKRPVDGSVAGSQGITPGLTLMWDCVWCDGTGKEKVTYTYRFEWLSRYFTKEKTDIEREDDQKKAAWVLGSAEDRLLKVGKGGDDNDRGTNNE